MEKEIDLDRMITDFKNEYHKVLIYDLDGRRKFRFHNRFEGVTELLSEEHLQKLSMTEAEKIFMNLRTGDDNSRKRNLHHFKKNKILKIRESIIYLMYGGDEPHQRFTELIQGKRKLDGAQDDLISTLLHFLEPNRFGIWNKAAKDGLKDLGITLEGIPRESIGRKYERFNERVRGISAEYELPELDVIDWFLAKISHHEIDLEYKGNSRPTKADNRPKVLPPKKEDSPERSITQSSTINRDQAVIRRVKEAESWTCQVCGESIVLPDGEHYYCEVHHIRPLGGNHKGIDEDSNTLCLCPNHHAEMEFGLFYIDLTTRKLVYCDSKHRYHGLVLRENQNLNASHFHNIDAKALKYHRDKFCSWTSL